MRIIAGRYRGKRLASVGKGDAGAHLRPTTDRVRESLFNLLVNGGYGDPVTGARALDLFAGTGALGLEALSRGAAFACFVDDGRAAQALLRENIDLCGAQDRSRLFRRDATRLGTVQGASFDLVFLDPPYGKGLGEKALTAAMAGGWLAEGALIVWEESVAPSAPAGCESSTNAATATRWSASCATWGRNDRACREEAMPAPRAVLRRADWRATPATCYGGKRRAVYPRANNAAGAARSPDRPPVWRLGNVSTTQAKFRGFCEIKHPAPVSARQPAVWQSRAPQPSAKGSRQPSPILPRVGRPCDGTPWRSRPKPPPRQLVVLVPVATICDRFRQLRTQKSSLTAPCRPLPNCYPQSSAFPRSDRDRRRSSMPSPPGATCWRSCPQAAANRCVSSFPPSRGPASRSSSRRSSR